jgi:hypothetical protein
MRGKIITDLGGIDLEARDPERWFSQVKGIFLSPLDAHCPKFSTHLDSGSRKILT